MEDLRGKVLTVRGPINPDQVGIALTHEHVFCDLRRSLVVHSEETDEFERLEVNLQNLWLIKRDWMNNLDNVQLSDFETAVSELLLFKAAGGGTLVDLTVTGINPDPVRLKQVAVETGLNIIAATGYYVSKTHPRDVEEKSIDVLAAELQNNIVNGFGNTDIRPGIVKIGVGGTVVNGRMEIHHNEEKLLRAASRVQQQMGVAVNVHTPRHLATEKDRPPSWWGLEILDIMEDAGADPNRVVLSHLDRCPHENLDFHAEIAKRGAYVEYDVWGKEFYFKNYKESNVSDSIRVEWVREMVNRGFLERILLAQDDCMKLDLVRYGGYGYGHILRNMVSTMKHRGITDAQTDTMLSENPKRILTIV